MASKDLEGGPLPGGWASDNLYALGRLLMGVPPSRHLDWQRLLEMARRHKVSPLLYWQVDRWRCAGDRAEKGWGKGERGEAEAEGWSRMPEGVKENLRADYYLAAARAAAVEGQLARVLEALGRQGVQAMVVKGAAVAVFYPDPALRIYGDLDLLVPERQLTEAEEALERLGYQSAGPKAWWEHSRHLPPMIGSEGQLTVEVHRRLDDPEGAGRLPVEDLWARVHPWPVAGWPAFRLEAVDAALHLCHHAMVQHRAHLGLLALCDLAQITRAWGPAEWGMLAQRATDYSLERPVYLMLVLMDRVLGLGAPPETVATLRPPASDALPEGVTERLLGQWREPMARIPVAAVRARTRATRLGQVRDFLWHLFLPRDGMAVEYSVPADSPRIWLAYLWRPVDLLGQYGRVAWGALRGDPRARAAWEQEMWLERWLRGEAET